MSSVVIAGNTSGTVTLSAPDIAGTTVLTLPSTSGTVITGSGGVTAVAQGGTGASTLSANAVILGNGTSAVQTVAPSTSGNVLTSNGTTWTSAALPAGGVTSLNGQTGAITNTDYNAIGSTYLHAGSSVGFVNGSTVAGSSIQYYASGNVLTSAGLSGTWRVMGGKTNGSTATGFGSLCMRIS